MVFTASPSLFGDCVQMKRPLRKAIEANTALFNARYARWARNATEETYEELKEAASNLSRSLNEFVKE